MNKISSPVQGYDRIALVHDFLVDTRGAERVFLEIARILPEADLFSPIHDPEGTERRFVERGVGVSRLNVLKPTSRTFRALLPLYPRATEALDLSRYDLIISSSSAWAHGVRLDPGQRHLCYCHNPFRYAWGRRDIALAGVNPLARPLVGRVLDRWRRWDALVASEVDRYVANSETTRRRIATSFGRSSAVLHPPVDVTRFTVGDGGSRFVVLSELVPHKRIDLVVSVFTALGLPLTVIGDGPDLARLTALGGATVEFTGRIPDEEVESRLAACSALVQCSTEEFGIASVEAQASGRPVIALGQGGALETVVPGVTGILFGEPTAASLTAALEQFESGSFDPVACRRQAERFSPEVFEQGLLREVDAMSSMPVAPRHRASRGRRRT